MKKAIIVHNESVKAVGLGRGVSRKVLAALPEMMTVEVCFDAGAVGHVHTHPHVQSTYVCSGAFRFTIDGVAVQVGAGDSIAFPPDIPHGTLCLKAGTLIDVFSPIREDFIV